MAVRLAVWSQQKLPLKKMWIFPVGLSTTVRNISVEKWRDSPHYRLSAFRPPRDTQRKSALLWKISYTGPHPCCKATGAIPPAEWFSSWVQNGAESRNSSWITESQNSLGCKGPLKVKTRDRRVAEERNENTTVTPSPLFPRLVENFKTKPEDEILSGDSNRKPPAVNFLCFEVLSALQAKWSLECSGMHSNDGLPLLQGAFHFPWNTWTQNVSSLWQSRHFTKTNRSLLWY